MRAIHFCSTPLHYTLLSLNSITLPEPIFKAAQYADIEYALSPVHTTFACVFKQVIAMLLHVHIGVLWQVGD